MKLREFLNKKIMTGKSLAKTIGVPQACISQWANGVRAIPAEHCPKIERATGGLVRCEDLRPDIDWGVLRCPVQGGQDEEAA